MLDMRNLRIDEQAHRRREGRPLGGLWQALDPERPADADLPLQDALRHFRQPGELARSAREDDPPSGGRATCLAQPVAHELEDLLHPRPDDARELPAWD